jgi:hypothetical protein
MKQTTSIFAKVINFYVDGFKNLTPLGKKLWLIIFIKVFIMFGILKLFFFPNVLNEKFENDRQKSEYVRNQLIDK